MKVNRGFLEQLLREEHSPTLEEHMITLVATFRSVYRLMLEINKTEKSSLDWIHNRILELHQTIELSSEELNEPTWEDPVDEEDGDGRNKETRKD